MAHQPEGDRLTSKVVRSSDATLARWRPCFCLRTAAEQRKTNGRQWGGRAQSRHDQPGNRPVNRTHSKRDFSGVRVKSRRIKGTARSRQGEVIGAPRVRACATESRSNAPTLKRLPRARCRTTRHRSEATACARVRTMKARSDDSTEGGYGARDGFSLRPRRPGAGRILGAFRPEAARYRTRGKNRPL